jgi:hypothetical protein
MTISIPPGYSVSLPVSTTFGPDGAVAVDNTTLLTNVMSNDVSKVRVTYPDPTVGVTNPLRSIRVDMDSSVPNSVGATVSANYTSPYDGTLRQMQLLVQSLKLPDAGSAGFGEPGAPFLTPSA